MCNCINTMSEMLIKKGYHKASIKLGYFENLTSTGKASTVLQIPFRWSQKTSTGKYSTGARIVTVAATHCPFCGEKL